MDLGAIRDFARTLLSEPTPSYWSNAELNLYINNGLRRLCSRSDLAEGISTFSTVQYQADYTLASTVTKVKYVEYVKGNSVWQLKPLDLKEFYGGTVRNRNTSPDQYNFWNGLIRLATAPSNAATNTTLSAAVTTTTATSISLTSSTSFPRSGRVIIDSEVISYWDTASNTLTGCTRGVEGTTAATHLIAATVSARDLWVYHYALDSTLSSDTDSPSIPAQFHEALGYYAASIGRRKSKDHDLAKTYMDEYLRYEAEALDHAKMKWKRSYNTK